MRLAVNTGRKNRHFGTIAQLCRAICSELRHVSTIGEKNLLNSNTFSTCPDNMLNFGLLTAEICRAAITLGIDPHFSFTIFILSFYYILFYVFNYLYVSHYNYCALMIYSRIRHICKIAR